MPASGGLKPCSSTVRPKPNGKEMSWLGRSPYSRRNSNDIGGKPAMWLRSSNALSKI